MTSGFSRALCLLALVLAGACGGDVNPNGVSATSTPLTVGGYPCPQTGTIAVSTIPADNSYYLTTFTGGTMSCGGQANGVDLYIADRQRFGCGTHVRVTNPANNKSCVANVADTGPNICVEEAASNPVIDASPAIAKALFGHSSDGWSDHALVVATVTSDPVGCGTAPPTSGCTTDSSCNNGQSGTQMVCLDNGQCGAGCHSNSDCPSGNTCDTSSSTWSCVAIAQCTSDAACNNGQSGTQQICSNSQCISGCHADSDCPSGDVCNGSQACVAAPGCQQDSDCNNGQTGTDQVCGSDGQCVAGCHADSDCSSGQTCDTSTSPGNCTQAPPAGCSVCTCDDGTCATDSAGDCDDNTNCLGNYCAVCSCDDGSCPTDQAGDCGDGSNCLASAYCGVCTCPGNQCPTDASGDCSDGSNCSYCSVCTCDDNTCPTDSNGDCDDNTNCNANYCGVCSCDDNTCPTDSAGDCDDGSNCAYCGVCSCDDNSCPTDSNGDCGDGSNCAYCSVCTCDDNSCPLDAAGDCDDNTNCLSSPRPSTKPTGR